MKPSSASGAVPRRAGFARGLLRLFSLVVPSPSRRRWHDEWSAELWILENSPPETGRSPSPIGLSLGALPPALWHRKEWAVAIMMQDVRFAIRTLTRNKGFTALALLIMALGIGANTTIFSMANATLLQSPEGIDDPARVVQIGRDRPDQGFDNMAYPWFTDFRDRAAGLEALAAYTARRLVVGRGAEVEVLTGQLVTGDYFSLLGVNPEAGRMLGRGDDEAPGAHPVAVISDGLWQRRFGGDIEVVGQRMRINGGDYEIVGVAESGFRGTDVVVGETDVWVPLQMAGDLFGPMYANFNQRGFSWLWMVGRLDEGTSVGSLHAELNGIYESVYMETWNETPDHEVGVIDGVGLRPDEREAVGNLVTLLLVVSGLVLAVACANLANLLLARGVARSQELGVRTALGAARRRLLREMITESIVLSLGGGLLALFITYWTAGLIPQLLPVGVSVSFAPDLQVLGFAVVLSVVAGIVFGGLPALRASQVNVLDAMRESSPLAGRRAGWLRGGLVVGQLALSFALLTVTIFAVLSLLRANVAEPGYNTRNVLTMTVSLDYAGYEPEAGALFFDNFEARAGALPGVDAAALGTGLPFAGWTREGVVFPTERPEFDRPYYEIDRAVVSDDYFRTLEIPLLAGEGFNASNAGGEMPPVVIVSESAARFLWPEEDNVVGLYLPMSEARIPEESMRVIGVVADVQVRSLKERPRPSMYLPATQRYEGARTLFVRAVGDPSSLALPLQQLATDLDPDLGIMQMSVLHERLGASLQDTLVVARLGGIFGGLSVVLAMLGLYGVVSFVASSRRHEVGVRVALGARSADVINLFVGQGARLALIGLVLGAILVVAAGGVLAEFLYGVSVTDPLTLSFIGVGVFLVALLATAVPAMRASRVDPVTALRRD